MNKELLNEIKKIIKIRKVKINLNQNEDNIIEEFINKTNWFLISSYQTLSESFIIEFQDKVYWKSISACQILSESFIREFKNKVDLYLISEYQTLSESFIIEFKDKINWIKINENKNIIKSHQFQDIINREMLIEELKQ